MRGHPKAAIAACILAVAATVLAACGGGGGGGSNNNNGGNNTASPGATTEGFGAAVNGIAKPSTKQGGTMNLLASSDCDSWDPQNTYFGWCWNMQRLFTRSLVGYSVVYGKNFKLAPDLATSLGKHNSNFTVWKYTLKPGLKFSTGKPITPKDVKYGIERLFATDVINKGPSSYFIDNIVHPKTYKGPYKSGDLSSIQTTKDTITFHLEHPYAQWDYVMALPAAAPVPYKVEGGGNYHGITYTKHPVASGPFEVQSYTQNKQITFVRNKFWKQSSDTIRHPLVDKVVLTIDTNPNDIDQKLEAGTADANASHQVGVTFQSKILTTPSLKANSDDATPPFTEYVSVVPAVIPNVHCRRAVFYAFDKAGALRALGGPTAGRIATSMTPPGIDGYNPNYNPYPSGSDGTGDIAKAKSELQQCGKPHGFSTKFAYGTPSTTNPNIFKAEQQALGRVGIKITAATDDYSTFYNTFVGSPKNVENQGLGLANQGWAPDFPTGYGFWNSIANGKNILPAGNFNTPELNDPVVNKILDEAPAGKTSQADWQRLDTEVMNKAVYLPYVWGGDLYYRSARMTNVACNNALAFGIYDFVNAGVGG